MCTGEQESGFGLWWREHWTYGSGGANCAWGRRSRNWVMCRSMFCENRELGFFMTFLQFVSKENISMN